MGEVEGSWVKAVAHFTAAPFSTRIELSFKKGDILFISAQAEGGWAQGTLVGETGWFPMSYVEVVEGSDLVDLLSSQQQALIKQDEDLNKKNR